MKKYYIITFKNTHDAICAEELFNSQVLIKVDIVPTPVYITQSCGISIRFEESKLEDVKNFINKNKFEFKNVYFRDKDGYKLINI